MTETLWKAKFPMMRLNIFWRLFLAYGALIVFSIGLLGIVIVARTEKHYLRQIEQGLNTRAVLVRESLRDRPEWAPEVLQRIVKSLGQQISTRITLIDKDGNVLADSEVDPRENVVENHIDRPEIQAAREVGAGLARRRHSSTVDRDMMYLALRNDGAGVIAFVRVALPLDDIQRQLAVLGRIIWTTAGLTAAAATLLAFWIARRNALPLQHLTESAGRIADGDYGHKVYAMDDDEAGRLARAFNHMSERLQEQFTQLEEDRRQLRAVLSSMVEGVVALDEEQQVLFTNERAGRLLDFDPAAAVGRKFWEVVRQRSVQEVTRRVLESAENTSAELDWNGAGSRSLMVHAARLSGPAGRGAVLVFHDTSELRRLERLRQEFVANVSHELKTPLSVIKACVETLLDGAATDPEPRATFLQQIEEQSNHLHALILDLLSLARMESGEELFEFQSVPLDDVVRSCLERHRARAEAGNQTLETSTPSTNGSAATAWADEDAVLQILDNLVDNALKYTPAGGRISVRWKVEDDQVCLEVEDSGIGIPERDLPRIFERFYRVDKARSRELGGTGLGLSIVKHLAQAMHGSVQAESKVGKGSIFRIRLPKASSVIS